MIPILVDGKMSTVTTPIVPNSELPALWGLKSMRQMGCIIDTRTNQCFIPGPSGLTIKPNSDTRTIQFAEAESGHLMVRTNQWTGQGRTPPSNLHLFEGPAGNSHFKAPARLFLSLAAWNPLQVATI